MYQPHLFNNTRGEACRRKALDTAFALAERLAICLSVFGVASGD